MRYLIVSTYPPMKCGIGKYAYQMANMLRDQGNVVNIISPEEGDGDFICNLKKGFNLLKIIKFNIFYDKIVIQYHETFYYDCGIDKNLLSIFTTYTSFFITFLLLNKKLEVVIHELPQSFGSRLFQNLEIIKWRICPKLVFHTRREIDDFESHHFKLPSDKYELRSPNTYYYKFRDIASQDARIELGLSLHKIIFLCIGFIQPHKGFDRAIRAFSEVAYKGMELYVVGSLRVRQSDYVAHLQDLKNMADNTSNVHIIEEFLPDEKFDLWLSASDVIVVPYREIWSSAVLARAKLFGKPAIASDVGGLKEQLTENDIIFRDDEELKEIFQSFAGYIEDICGCKVVRNT